MAEREDRTARLRAVAAVWVRSPALWRGLLVAGSVVGVFLWAIVVLGIALAMAEEGAEQWWLVLVFGVAILALVLAGAYLLAARLFNRAARPPAGEAGRASGAAERRGGRGRATGTGSGAAAGDRGTAGAAQRAGAGGPPAAGHRTLQPGDRRRAVRRHWDGQGPPEQHLPQAGARSRLEAVTRARDLRGISPSRTTPNILVFTDPRSGERHGYFDQWATDDSFHYTGEGQRGDQTMTRGNLAILSHRADGRALRVFQGASGTVQYVGQFVLDELEPFTITTAPSTNDGPPRQVIRFHLLPIDRAVTTAERGSLGRPFRRRDEDVEITSREAIAYRDPDAAGRGLRAHNRLQNRLSDLVEAAGYTPIDPESPIDPAFDLAWFDGPTLFVVEVKSCTQDNQTQQLRLGIGQVLDYEDTLLASGHTVQAVLYVEEQPTDPRWSGLAQRHDIRLIWPGTEHRLLNA